jgi:hypothetical protein
MVGATGLASNKEPFALKDASMLQHQDAATKWRGLEIVGSEWAYQ